MKIKYFYTAVALAITVFLTVTAFTSGGQGEGEKTNKDLIKFSHKTHADVVECADCHTAVSESTTLTDMLLPKMETCGTCHDVEDEKNCKMCHYEDVLEPLIQKQPELKFNHKFHLSEQKLVCETCHKGINDVDYAFQSPKVYPAMSDCYTCHNNETVATNECSTCHTSTVNLIPETHRTADFMKNHKFASMAANANCAMCHDDNFCETCHAATTMLDSKNTAKDFYTPYSPHKFTDNAKEQQLTRVHDLNYAYTHGIDAKGKTSECRTCHNTETFCVECHASKGGDFASEGFVPSSHTQPNFVIIGGYGSGGGEHAVLAKRDIESCASCHDTQGADPNCILCHTDNDGIRGTNPRTHVGGFMHNIEGDWHNDQGAVCYNCHTDANAHPGGIPGVGFCGYCHGSK